MSLASPRARRQNAGNKMHAMVEEERAKMQNGEIPASDDDDDFDKAVDLEDTVDADFTDTDSEEEKAIEGAGKAEEARLAKAERRQKRKASKQRMIVPRFASASASAKTKKGTKTAPLAPQSEHDHKPSNGHTAKRLKILEPVLRASNRSSAVRKAMETEALEQEREAVAAAKRGRKRRSKSSNGVDGSQTYQGLTQEQLLQEAKLTEIENTDKLKLFQQQEAEEKKLQRRMASRKAPIIIQPIVHYKSSTTKVSNDADSSAFDNNAQTAQLPRTEYVLDKLDQDKYPFNPWARQLAVLPPKICPITGLPARYFHPRAKIPYANARAFQVLEEIVRGEHAYFYYLGAWSSSVIGDYE